MDALGTYQINETGSPRIRKWLFRGLIASLLIHLGLIAFFQATPLPNFSEVSTDRLVPRVFNIQRLEINPKLLEETQETPSEQLNKDNKTELKPVELPPEAAAPPQEPTEIRAIPSPTEIVSPIINQKPEVNASAPEAAKLEAESTRVMDKEMDTLRDSLLKDNAAASSSALLKFSERGDAGNSRPGTSGSEVKGFSNLDNLLGGQGLKAGTPPILMPTDLLFDYDKADLRPGAVISLQKLGKLIQRNPQATFSIEGHTDSFGAPEYNQDLSERRAESVKTWLVSNMDIDPQKIQTVGYGSTRLLAPASGNVEQQQLNRRVEIVIKTKK